MTSNGTGRCLVCYAETKNRCSRCKGAGVDLFFCSPEHQKLVWSGHQIVCGFNASLFLLPYLSQEELAAATKNLFAPYETDTTLFDVLNMREKLSVNQAKMILQSLTEDSELESGGSLGGRQAYLALIRTSFPWREESSRRARLLRKMSMSVLDLVSDNLIDTAPDKRTWAETELLHRLFSCLTIVYLGLDVYKDPDQFDENIRQHKVAYDAYETFQKDHFSPAQIAAFRRAMFGF